MIMTSTRNNPGRGLRLRNKNNKAITKFTKKVQAKKAEDKSVAVKSKKADSGECINYDEKGRQHLQTLLLGLNGGEPVTFLSDDRFNQIQSKIQLAPVAVLQQQSGHKFFGVYAKEALKAGLNMGEYLGEKLSTKGTDATTNVDYAFDLKNRYEMNAKYKRSWHAMVNSPSSADTANVEASRERDENGDMHIYYYLKRDIKEGEQLLIYYGDDYKFTDKRFLNPSDNWESSIKKIDNNATYYQMDQTLPDELRETLGLSYERFAIPIETKLHKKTVNLPLLALDKLGDAIPQSMQENMTLLHLACLKGDVELADRLLKKGANPNQQMSMAGLCPLHCAIMSKALSFELKKKLIDLLLRQPAISLVLSDKHERSILHHAIEAGEVDVIKYILELDKNVVKNNTKATKAIINDMKKWVNETDQCYLLLAIEKNNMNVLNALKTYICAEDLEFYLPPNDFEFLETALKNACQNSTYEQWNVLKQWFQVILETSDVKKQLNTLMPTHRDQPVVIPVSHVTLKRKLSEMVNDNVEKENATPVNMSIKSRKKDKKIVASHASQAELKRRSAELAEQKKANSTISDAAIVQSILKSKESPGKTFIDSIQSNHLPLYRRTRALINWFGENKPQIDKELAHILPKNNISLRLSVEKANIELFKLGTIAYFYNSIPSSDRVDQRFSSNSPLKQNILENWQYAFVYAAFYEKNVYSFLGNADIKQKMKERFSTYNNVDQMASDLALYATENVMFINDPELMKKININGIEDIKKFLKEKLDYVAQNYLDADNLALVSSLNNLRKEGENDSQLAIVKQIIESPKSPGQTFANSINHADLFRKNQFLFYWFEINQRSIANELSSLNVHGCMNAFNDLSTLLLVRKHYFPNGEMSSHLNSELSPQLLAGLVTHWKCALLCSAQRSMLSKDALLAPSKDALLAPFLYQESLKKLIKEKLANYNYDIEQMVNDLILDSKAYYGLLYNEQTASQLIDIEAMTKIGFKTQLEYLVGYYQSENDIFEIERVKQPALNLNPGQLSLESERTIVSDIKKSTLSVGQTFFKTVELNQHHLFRKHVPLVLWFSRFCKQIENEITELNHSNNLSFYLFKEVFDEVNQLIEIDGYFFTGSDKTNSLEERDSKMRSYILNHWHYAFISAVYFNSTEVFIKDEVLKEQTKEHCLVYNGDFELMANDLILYAKDNTYIVSDESALHKLRIKLKNKLQGLFNQYELEDDLDSTMSGCSSIQNGSK